MLILPGQYRVLMPLPERFWREPSLSQPRDDLGNQTQTRFRVTGRLDDGFVKWRGWFDSRHDADAFLDAIIRFALLGEPVDRALWDLPTPAWHPDLGGPGVRYDFASVTFLTSSPGSTLTWSSPADWSNFTNTIEAIGGGGSGGRCVIAGTSSQCHGTGGGGGEYRVLTNYNVATPGVTTVSYLIGTRGAAIGSGTSTTGGNNGAASWWDSTSVLNADFGSGGLGNTSQTTNGGTGGGPGTGGSGFSGGRGGKVTTDTSGVIVRTGGGGAGGPNGAGGNGGDITSPSGNSGSAGGPGDAGSGGSGGAGSGAAGGNGAEWDASHGSGGGGGAGTGSGSTSGSGGNYGGGSGGNASGSSLSEAIGAATQGIIVVTYAPITTTQQTISVVQSEAISRRAIVGWRRTVGEAETISIRRNMQASRLATSHNTITLPARAITRAISLLSFNIVAALKIALPQVFSTTIGNIASRFETPQKPLTATGIGETASLTTAYSQRNITALTAIGSAVSLLNFLITRKVTATSPGAVTVNRAYSLMKATVAFAESVSVVRAKQFAVTAAHTGESVSKALLKFYQFAVQAALSGETAVSISAVRPVIAAAVSLIASSFSTVGRMTLASTGETASVIRRAAKRLSILWPGTVSKTISTNREIDVTGTQSTIAAVKVAHTITAAAMALVASLPPKTIAIHVSTTIGETIRLTRLMTRTITAAGIGETVSTIRKAVKVITATIGEAVTSATAAQRIISTSVAHSVAAVRVIVKKLASAASPQAITVAIPRNLFRTITAAGIGSAATARTVTQKIAAAIIGSAASEAGIRQRRATASTGEAISMVRARGFLFTIRPLANAIDTVLRLGRNVAVSIGSVVRLIPRVTRPTPEMTRTRQTVRRRTLVNIRFGYSRGRLPAMSDLGYFDPADPTESQNYAFNFKNDIAPGDTITSPIWTCELVETLPGYTPDPSPASRLSGGATVNVDTTTGLLTITTQKVGPLLAGNKYRLKATVVTVLGAETVVDYGAVWCKDFA